MENMMKQSEYIVIKACELDEAVILDGDLTAFHRVCNSVASVRFGKNKPLHLECVVVEKDWPEYEPTCRAIEKRLNTERPKKYWTRAYEIFGIDNFSVYVWKEKPSECKMVSVEKLAPYPIKWIEPLQEHEVKE